MKVPFVVLSYGDFAKTKKLFSYEHHGIHTLPLFSNPSIAYKYAKEMNVQLKELGDNRVLSPQVCTDKAMALRMFETITAFCPDLMQVAVDPMPPLRGDVDDPSKLELAPNIVDIDEILLAIQDANGMDESSDS